MALDSQGSLAGATGSRCRIYYQDGANWREIPGVNGFELAPSTRTATTYSAFEGAFSETGPLDIGAATFAVASYVPNHPAWEYLDSRFNSNTNVQLRVETNKNVVFNSGDATVAIASDTGLCTFSPANVVDSMTDVARGHQIVTASARYTIRAISDENPRKFYVVEPESNVSAIKFEVEFPILQFLVTGKLSSNGGASISEDAANSSEFIVQPAGRVPLPKVLAAHTEGI